MPLHPLFDDAPQAFGREDFTFRARLGSLVNGLPESHDHWRFTTGDPMVADDLAEMFGGKPQPWQTETEEDIEIHSNTKSLPVILESLSSEYVLWGRNKPIRICTGLALSDDKECECRKQYPSKKEWVAAGKDGLACQPTVKASFRLSANPDLGLGRFQSSSRTLADGDPAWKIDYMEDGAVWQPPIGDLEQALSDHGGRAMANIDVVEVSFKTKAGKHVQYNKPQITITGAAPAVVEALIDA